MMRIGLTGMSGSGKSYVCDIFKKYGIVSVSSDALVHDLYSKKNPCTETLARLFGSGVLREDHSINRPILASIVFSDPDKLALLNHTVHPFVVEKLEDIAREHEKQGDAALVIEAPQLFEAGLDKTCDYVISVFADHETRVLRIAKRDGISQDLANRRLANQYSDAFFREHSDFCIENSTADQAEQQIKEILSRIGLLHE